MSLRTRLTFVTAGSRGDVQPLVALARGAQAYGFDVRVAANPLYADLIEQNGLAWVMLPGQSPKEVWADESKASAATPSRFRYVGTLKKILRRKGPDRQSLMNIVEACEGSDVVVYSHSSVVAYHAAEYLDVKAVAAYLYPNLPSRAYPALLVPPGLVRNGYFNATSHFLLSQLFWTVDRPWVNDWRVNDLSLGALGIVPPLNYLFGRRGLHLHGFSPNVVERPADWPANSHITGYWFLDEGSSWSPPDALVRFIDAGPPPVCVTFGSEIDSRPDELYSTVSAALESVGARAVLVSGWSDRDRLNQTDRVFAVDSAPYDWLFPKMACVVHHAGTGTAAEVLRAGTPSVCIPFHGEQRYWADVMQTLGVAGAPIPRAALTAQSLASSLRFVLNEASVAERANALGRSIRSEKGVETAARLIDEFIQGRGRSS